MASSISFLKIPLDLRTPGTYVEVDNSRALQGLTGLHQRLLIVGQRLTTGETPANTPVLVVSANDGVRRFGQGSLLARMIAKAKAANSYTEMWAVAVDDDPAGVAATGLFTFGGAPTAAGTVALMIGGARVRVGVALDDTPTTVAAKAAAAINAVTDLPVTATAAEGVVTLSARHKGEVGNSLDLRYNYYTGEALPKGLTLTITAMSGGAANPEIGPALASLVGRRYHYVVSPYSDAANLSALEDWLEERWDPMIQQEGLGFTAAKGTTADLSTLGSSRNSEFLCLAGSGLSPTTPEIWAAVWGAVAAFNLNIDPARPLQTLALPGILPPATEDIPDYPECNVLLHDGISTFMVDDGGDVLIQRAITTYQTNALGLDDPSYLDVNTMAILAYIKDQVRTRISNVYPRHKLADDDTTVPAGQALVRPKDINAELVALALQMEANGIIEGVEQFKTDLKVVRNSTDTNRVDALIPPNLVGQFRVFAGQVQFIL